MTNSLSSLFSACVVLTVFPLTSFAMPSVSGNTVTWPSDGWYQVQRADNFETVCEGIESSDSSVSDGPCVIDSGSYIVINHTSGERFENISATTASTSPDSVLVEGDRISWPDNGWYQVQDASTFLNICEGGTGCTVAPGNYIVINHTTGERFNDIGVGTGSPSDSSGRPVGVVVQGDTIRWPDNGWYQVQNASNFESLCEGGSECQVTPGSYIVINHSSGERTLLEVSGDSTTSDEPDAIASTRVLFDITVPAYVSNALQVRIMWGDRDGTAAWVTNESWTATDDLPANTENQLRVTFSDQNGAITLGSFEQAFRTGTNATETVQITAEQFDIVRWDSDGDGVSNLDELITGTNPSVVDTDTSSLTPPASTPPTTAPQAFEARIELLPEKVFRLSWGESSAATHYRVLENPDGISGFNTVSGDLSIETRTFDHRVPLFRRLNARYMVQACNDLSCISSEELFLTGSLAGGVGIIASPNGTTGTDYFASSVALSRDGRTLAVSSIGDDSAAVGINGDQLDNSSEDTGAVYVYRLNNSAWELQAFIKASNADAGDLFGRELSLSADGNMLAVGVEGERSAAAGINGDQLDNTLNAAGAVYLFSFNDGAWRQQAYLKTSNPGRGNLFGSSVSLSASGNTLAVGARNELSDNDSITFRGALYLFERTDTSWQQQAHIPPGSPLIGGGRLYTRNISLSADGDILAVGGSPPPQISQAQGGAFVLERNDGVWRQQSYLDPAVIGAHPSLGLDAGALSDDGRTLVLSATRDFSPATGINADPFASTDIIRDAGAVHVFTFVDGSWRQQAYLKSTVPEKNASFGRGVALSADGDTIAVLSRDDTGGVGIFDGYNFITEGSNIISTGALTSAYVFHRNSGVWSEGAYIKPPACETLFGDKVALDATGNTIVITGGVPNCGDTPDSVAGRRGLISY